MSQDIRSYFFKTNGSSSTKSDSDSPRKKKRTHRVIESDDEDEDSFVVSKKKPKELPSTSKPKPKPEVVVQVESFFGNKPVHQKKQTVTANKTESSKKKNPPKKEGKSKEKKKDDTKEVIELSFENDDELEASILQTDDEILLSSEKKKKDVKQPFSPEKKKKGDVVITPEKKRKGDDPKGKEIEVEKKKTPKKESDFGLKQNKTPKQDERKSDSGLISSEQKRKNAEAYQKYLQRSGPKNPGSKKIPEGTPTCLQGLTFVITGILDSLEREEATELIQKCGGRVTGSVSKKTHYVVVGEEPGASKIQKADSLGTKKINEDELLELIREKSGNCNAEKQKDNFVEGTPEKTSKYFEDKKKRVRKIEEKEDGPTTSKVFKKDKPKTELKMADDFKDKICDSFGSSSQEAVKSKLEKTGGDMLWVDKYRPKSTKHIVGQMGEKSNVKKLIKWLQDWHKNHSGKVGKKIARPSPWAQNDDGSYFKAALLSGPPGVGKTTTVHLVCEELGFDVIEFNASDTRSKRLLQEEISDMLKCNSIRGFFEGSAESFRKQVLVMDEVDGMAGNEDRGGIQELIQIVKSTKVPIVGICNDRNHPKMRSLVNYCFDLRFQRPRIEQIKAAMKSICFKENVNISGEALEELIIASNHDLRQVLHNLSLLASGDKPLSLEEAKTKSQQAKKPLNLGPWDVVRKVFSASEHEKMSFIDKTDLFFQDYSLGPLFVQDTYIRVKPYKAKNCEKKKLELLSKAADSLALGDVVERTIRSQNAWSLLPVQAIFSSVLPGHYMSGHVQGQIQFPVWFGKNSRSNKFNRLLQDLHSSLRINTTGSKESVNLDYITHLRDVILKPLVDEGSQGVQKSLEFMLNYHLTREDLDSILELSSWPGCRDLYSEVDSKVKAALTRALNKEGPLVVARKKNTKVKTDTDEFDLEDNEEDVEETENDNIDSDPMIKRGKLKTKKEPENKVATKDEKKTKTKKESKKGKK